MRGVARLSMLGGVFGLAMAGMALGVFLAGSQIAPAPPPPPPPSAPSSAIPIPVGQHSQLSPLVMPASAITTESEFAFKDEDGAVFSGRLADNAELGVDGEGVDLASFEAAMENEAPVTADVSADREGSISRIEIHMYAEAPVGR